MITEISLNSFCYFDENRKALSCTRSVCQMSIPTKGSGCDFEIISQAFTLCHQLKLPSAALTEQRQQQHYAWALLAREVCVTDSLFLFTEAIGCAQTLVIGEERPVPQVQFHYKKDIEHQLNIYLTINLVQFKRLIKSWDGATCRCNVCLRN